MRIGSTIVLLGSMVGGCVAITQPPAQVQTTFDYEEHRPFTEPGDNSVKGQGFLRQQGGGVVTCAGSAVYVMPATPFFREILALYRAGRQPQFASTVDESYRPMIKQSQCDAQGNFAFGDLPNGRWFVATEVVWTVGYSQQGGGLLREIETSRGETITVLLSDADRL